MVLAISDCFSKTELVCTSSDFFFISLIQCTRNESSKFQFFVVSRIIVLDSRKSKKIDLYAN